MLTKSPPEVGRLGVVAAWVSAVCCLPYLSLKVLWTFDVAVGIRDRSVLDESGWMAGNALMAVVELTGLVLVLALVRPWARRAPAWLLLFPVWVGTGLLYEIIVGSALYGLSPSSSDASSSSDLGAFHAWVFVLVYSSFAGQGIALAIAFATYVRSRWGRLLGRPTGELLAGRPAGGRRLTEVVAVLAIGVGILCWYWAAGGTGGLSDDREHPTWSMSVAGVVAATTAALGLLGLAGHWGQARRFWLPVALTWLGSGALAAFDGLNQLFLVSGLSADAHWSLVDLVVLLKVAVGIAAGALGVLAVALAAEQTGRAEAPGETGASCTAQPDGGGGRI